jgi:glycosyltransferase involved in cell wall biosynthesis
MNNMMQNKKKIDIVVKYFYPVAAGIETNVLETYKTLVTLGWDVTVHTSNVDYTTGDILPPKETIKGIKVIRYPISWPCFKPNISYSKTNLVCLHNFDVLPQAYILIKSLFYKLCGKKHFALILTPHGGFNPEWRVFAKLIAFVKCLYHYSLGVLLINLVVDGVRAVSDWEKNQMIKKGINSKKISVISNGIEDAAFEDIEKDASEKIKAKVRLLGDYIIRVGRIYPIKNDETTIRALVDVPENIKYVIVGPTADRKYLAYLKALAKSLGVADRVVFTGVLRGVDKYYIIKHAKIMVHMAIWESFCNVVHEAMSQGVPVIAADNTALSYLVKDGINGLLVDTKGHKEVARKINYILDEGNLEAVNKMSEAGVLFAKDNTWAKTAAKMHKLYICTLQCRS